MPRARPEPVPATATSKVASTTPPNHGFRPFITKSGRAAAGSILPTSSTLLAALSFANIPYSRWFKFLYKLTIIWTIMAGLIYINDGGKRTFLQHCPACGPRHDKSWRYGL
nr:MAG: hypothetical protein DIU66_06310 [Bacillota bacterium]